MERTEARLESCRDFLRGKTDLVPEIGLVLGSGLGNYADQMEVVAEIPYAEIEDFPQTGVPGHEGKFVFGRIGGKRLLVMKGRVHYYEGYDMEDVVLPIRLMGMLGARILILTNAAGGIHPSLEAGDLMLIEDQIASFVPSPLRGQNPDSLGPRFPDMSQIYDPALKEVARRVAKKQGIALKSGIYLQAPGPNYESPAEVRMYERCGADALGMSTACEAVAAKHMGMRILGISCISNKAAGLGQRPLNHREVQEAAQRVSSSFEGLVTGIVGECNT